VKVLGVNSALKKVLQTDSGFSGEFTGDMAHHTGSFTPFSKTSVLYMFLYSLVHSCLYRTRTA
jgi:hypothetical protein